MPDNRTRPPAPDRDELSDAKTRLRDALAESTQKARSEGIDDALLLANRAIRGLPEGSPERTRALDEWWSLLHSMADHPGSENDER